MPLIYGRNELDAMWGIRRVFDPDGVFNPGKVLPEDTDPAAVGAPTVRPVPGSMTTRTHAPETVAATQAIVRDARKNGSTLLATGRRTWPGAGGWTRHADALVATTSLDRLDHYEPADLTLTAGAGMGIQSLDRDRGKLTDSGCRSTRPVAATARWEQRLRRGLRGRCRRTTARRATTCSGWKW